MAFRRLSDKFLRRSGLRRLCFSMTPCSCTHGYKRRGCKWALKMFSGTVCGLVLISNHHSDKQALHCEPKDRSPHFVIVGGSWDRDRLPRETKIIRRRQDNTFVAGYSDQGPRSSMEDAIFIDESGSFAVVCDGHGGGEVAQTVAASLYPTFVTQLTERGTFKKFRAYGVDIGSCLHQAINAVDSSVLENRKWRYQGSTVCAVHVCPSDLWVANVGDSRAIMCRDEKAVQISRDHKPDDPGERQRIESLGGTVSLSSYEVQNGRPRAQYRVNDNLAMTRAIGDADLRPHVSSEADIFRIRRDFMKDNFVLIASDGLWDVFDNQDAVDFVLRESKKDCSLHTEIDELELGERSVRICKALVAEARSRGSVDNISAIILWLR